MRNGFFYWWRKRLFIAVGIGGETPFGFRFRRSLIENEPIELEKTLEAITGQGAP